MTKQVHPLSPIFSSTSEILILGSFPSVKSRASLFYYAHPQNRFWKILPKIFSSPQQLQTEEEKVQFLLDHKIALWDVLHSCVIEGSSDSSIKEAEPNDLSCILDQAKIRLIVLNGKAAEKLFMKYQKNAMTPSIPVIQLPSTSPANAGYSEERLVTLWRDALRSYKE